MIWRTGILVLALALLAGCATAVATGAAAPGRTADGRSLEQRHADSRITAAVNRALVQDRTLPAMAIHVETYRGRVTLTGKVADRKVAARAVAKVASVPGVQAVDDRMVVAR